MTTYAPELNQHAIRLLFWRKEHIPAQHTRDPIFCTCQFVNDVDRIFGNATHDDLEASAYAHVIANSSIFYKCQELPFEMMARRKATVSTKMDTPEVRKIVIDELERTKGRSRYVSIHDHPMNFPHLSKCDIRTYERCRKSETELSPFGCGNPYPVVLINLSCDEKIELLGFWVIDGHAHRTSIEIIPDESDIVEQAWRDAPQLEYYSPEASLSRNIAETLDNGWKVILGVNQSTRRKALLVTNPEGRNKAIPFSDVPLRLDNDKFWKYVDWQRLFVDSFEQEIVDEPQSGDHATDIHGNQPQPTEGEHNATNNTDDSLTPEA